MRNVRARAHIPRTSARHFGSVYHHGFDMLQISMQEPITVMFIVLLNDGFCIDTKRKSSGEKYKIQLTIATVYRIKNFNVFVTVLYSPACTSKL